MAFQLLEFTNTTQDFTRFDVLVQYILILDHGVLSEEINSVWFTLLSRSLRHSLIYPRIRITINLLLAVSKS